jgi:predicted regulator of Ras-like GTPase activity (Roadblock/LC7/MglB family)
MGVEPPTVTISRSWSGLLLEGARRLDEAKHSTTTTSSSLSTSTTSSLFTQEVKPMATKKKSEQLADALTELLQGSADIEGAAIVGTDGLVYSANVPQRALDENMVGATSAAILGLSKRSVSQLKRGNFSQTLIQGEDGNIVVTGLDDQTLFVGLTAKNVNLGMAFAEVRTMASRLREIL